jgi:hypothetical protein
MTNSILSIFAQGQTGLSRPVQRPLQALLQGQTAAVMPASRNRPINRPASRPISGVPLPSHAGGSSSPPGQRRGPGCTLQPPAAPSWEELLGRR